MGYTYSLVALDAALVTGVLVPAAGPPRQVSYELKLA